MGHTHVDWKSLGVTLLIAAAVLVVHRRTFWRPFDDTPQESLASFHAYGLAAASGVHLWPNPIVARDVDVTQSQVRPYPHWPNGFFLLFEGVLRIFGRSETVGRWFAVLGTLLAFTLTVVSLGRQDLLLYLTLPLILLSGPGRDSIPFVFIDVAMYMWIGILLWITAHLWRTPHYNFIFRAAMLVALFFNQLVLPYVAVIVVFKWFERGSIRDLILDMAVLATGGAAVLFALASSAGSLQAGAKELYRIADFRARSQTPR